MVPFISNLAASSANTLWAEVHTRQCPEDIEATVSAQAHYWPHALWTLVKQRCDELQADLADLPEGTRQTVADALRLAVDAFSYPLNFGRDGAAARIEALCAHYPEHEDVLTRSASLVRGCVDDTPTAERVLRAMRFDINSELARYIAC